MGHPSLATLAMPSTCTLFAPGIFAVTSRCDAVTVQPALVLSSETVAVAEMETGEMPALPNSAENAIAKQPAWAAAISSSGFAPTPFSKRVPNEYCVSRRTPLSVERLPLPSFNPPCQTAVALRFIIFLSSSEWELARTPESLARVRDNLNLESLRGAVMRETPFPRTPGAASPETPARI